MTPQQFDIIYHAVQLYTERIRLVQQAMRELRPVMFNGLPLNTASTEEIIEYCRQLDLVPDTGLWRDSDQIDWRYNFHGGGLRLIQLVTRELLDWDADMEGHADLDAFDEWFFGTWFVWLLSTNRDLMPLFSGYIPSLISEAFDQLEANGLISHGSSGYKLVLK